MYNTENGVAGPFPATVRQKWGKLWNAPQSISTFVCVKIKKKVYRYLFCFH